jgi:hypothetical protein
MSVYVDDMRARFGRMVMCHMIADASEELHAMAARIGVARRWVQDEGMHREHYDVSLGARREAVKLGAVEVTQMQLGRILRSRRPPLDQRSAEPHSAAARPVRSEEPTEGGQ